MKTLYEACVPRESVFDEKRREDVLDLTDLIEGRINPESFFEESYLTNGMEILLKTAFKRLAGESETGLIKLTQSMGGGKTHNMIALGLLAKYPQYRKKVMGDFGEKYVNLSEIKVVAFTGRESDAPFGIWGAIAEQLGKRDIFKDYYSPLRAPGQSAWVNLLKDETVLILLDELPPYLENAKSIAIGDSNLAVVTTTALANLFNALNKPELSRVCVVISDLRATYESGSELLQSSFKELEGEIDRFAMNVEPVRINSDEIYHILRKKLFKSLPNENEINQIAIAYKEKLEETKQLGFTMLSPDQLYTWIKDSYPFHPSTRDLYARFKENPGFQQTRGLIRLMRAMISQLWRGDEPLARRKYLVNPYDFDLNDSEMLTMITQIKPSLSNAIAHDIASNGRAVAETIDRETTKTTDAQDAAKLVLVSSLADVPNAVLGLAPGEILGYLTEPGRDITLTKKALEEFTFRAWYLFTDRDGKLFFQNTKNLIAELNSLVESYDNETAKKELRNVLSKMFEPKDKDCYQRVVVFPAIDEIELSRDEVTLVITEPYMSDSGLNPDIEKFYEDQRYKNRVMFLTGSRRTMDKLYEVTKEYKAINEIIKRMNEEKIPENDSQYQRALEKRDRINLELLQAARETFVQLYYPTAQGLQKVDFRMEFVGNEYNGEKQIKDVLTNRKFITDVSSDSFRKRCEERLFTQQQMRWVDIKERAATNPSWPWHLPRALDDLKDSMIRKGIWREEGGYINKGPFPKEKTSVKIQEIFRDEETGEVTLKLTPVHGDVIHYEIGKPATISSPILTTPNDFKTRELKISFLCVDSKGEHETGEPIEWQNKIRLKYKVYDSSDGSGKIVELLALPVNEKIKYTIKYTTDGSSPFENGQIYDSEEKIFIPKKNGVTTTIVQAIAMAEDITSEKLMFTVQWNSSSAVVSDEKRLILKRKLKTDDTSKTYRELELLKKYNAKLLGTRVVIYSVNPKTWVEFVTDNETLETSAEALEKVIEDLRQTLLPEGKHDITMESATIIFEKGLDFKRWVSDKQMSLDDFKQEEILQP